MVSEAKLGIADRIRAVDAAAYRKRIEAETPARARRERDAEAHRLVRDRQRIRDGAIHFIEAQVEIHNCGTVNIICQFCKSKNFAAELPSDGKFTSCCRKGKIKLEKPQMHKADNEFSTSEHIDKFVRAEIPSSIENPRLHEIVTKCLMHMAPVALTILEHFAWKRANARNCFPKNLELKLQ
ncbi:hypothetical protein AVEN_199463-1 [Araneus ventricosus]|uniref:Helitron helicase-like domain-containing protein n=1 Tax=Araneus ventricosus TaxID=182803 RepID=A0A4Y2LED8_ARAVE|nr:hypothetical protein AVEN_199463-1 [Araneus ventricosus]